ncbi:GGDEF domain-containing protein [Butyrivibrio sp. JL13D10]|uniref:GGDEF domain-containing protein n=1 Tax=Butyrivibrio sp. JL13D10 TaxID=3236815 RepID=UPI0038B45247
MRLRDYMRINVWLLPLLLVFVPIILIMFGSSFMTTPSTYYKAILNDGWSVRHGDFYAENVELKNLDIGTANRGDEVVISRDIPKENVPSACLMFRSIQAAVIATIDGKQIYSYGEDYAQKGKLIPKHFIVIPLNDAYATTGKRITITFKVYEDNAFSGLSEVYYGNRHDVELSFIQSKRLPFFIGGFLSLFSFLLLTLSSYLYIYHSHDLSLIFSSVISFTLGAYNLAYNDIFCFLSDHEVFFCMIEYITLFSVPFAIITFLVSSHPELNTNLNKTLIAINALFPIVTLILHLLDIAHMNNFVSTLHVIALSEAIMILPQLVLNVIKSYEEQKSSPEYVGKTSDSILLLGLLLFIICSVIDIIKYNVFKFFVAGGEISVNINFMTLGALCFVLCLFVFYFYHGIEHINSVYVKQHLEGLAYTDALTGLMNRAKCMQYMASVRGSFALISLDLDNLKTVNDSLGHQEGDRMLSSFASLLKQTFGGLASLIGRTGGDEFLIAIEDPAPGSCEKLLIDLNDQIASFNSSEKKFNISTSCGCAYSNEVKDQSAENVFVLADNRMYAEKEAHHASKMGKFVNDIIGSSLSNEGGESDYE